MAKREAEERRKKMEEEERIRAAEKVLESINSINT